MRVLSAPSGSSWRSAVGVDGWVGEWYGTWRNCARLWVQVLQGPRGWLEIVQNLLSASKEAGRWLDILQRKLLFKTVSMGVGAAALQGLREVRCTALNTCKSNNKSAHRIL
jgi:hypothetical protein